MWTKAFNDKGELINEQGYWFYKTIEDVVMKRRATTQELQWLKELGYYIC